MQHSFLAPLGKSKDEIEREVISGRFPPCILYKIMYRSPEERRTRRALLKVKLNGADVSLFFSCSIKEEIRECVFVLYIYLHYRLCELALFTQTCLLCAHKCVCIVHKIDVYSNHCVIYTETALHEFRLMHCCQECYTHVYQCKCSSSTVCSSPAPCALPFL